MARPHSDAVSPAASLNPAGAPGAVGLPTSRTPKFVAEAELPSG